MTRENKIGLLVGLAFIIMIGILLSEYNRLETQPAALAGVADNLRTGAATPHNDSNLDETVPPPAPIPTRQVPTREDLRAEPVVEIGPGRLPIRLAAHGNTPGAGEHPIADGSNGSGNVGSNSGNNIHLSPGGPIGDSHGNPGPNRTPTPNPNPGDPGANPNPIPPVASSKQYVAQSGDSVSRMAGRLLGANNKANREAIIAANPSLKQNANNVIIGRTYTIPARKPANPAVAAAATPTDVTPPPAPTAAPPAPAGQQYWYTVKENDNLWRIAKEQLGNGNAWAAIKELNHDVLKGGDSLHANMRLRLPAKPVSSTASTND